MRKAAKDTYATETLYGVPIRRFVRAGDKIPDTWDVADVDVEDASPSRRPNLARARRPHDADVPAE